MEYGEGYITLTDEELNKEKKAMKHQIEEIISEIMMLEEKLNVCAEDEYDDIESKIADKTMLLEGFEESYRSLMTCEEGVLRVNNIFRYATSELSQDAFICWLLSYATEDGWYANYQLRKCAVAFMDKILQSKGSCWKADTRITGIHKQYKNIDVLVDVGDFKIIIEDKTFTCSHGDQVNRYKKSLLDEGIAEENIICVFYKIEEQAKPEPNVDFEFTRKILLDIFRKYGEFINHPIFVDYLEYLEWMEYRVNAWQRLPIAQWNNDGKAYVGFFTHLKECFLDSQKGWCGWNYVANPTGGFMGLWWFPYESKELDGMGFTEDVCDEIYLQFENNIIAVKYSLDPKRTYDKQVVSGMRSNLFRYLENKINEETNGEIVFKKKTFRYGTWMTVGYVEYDENNYLERLQLLKKALDELIGNGINKSN